MRKGSSVPVVGNIVNGVFLDFASVSCAYGEYLLCWSPFCVQDLGYIGVPPAGHALWAEVGGSITFVTSGEFLGSLKKVL